MKCVHLGTHRSQLHGPCVSKFWTKKQKWQWRSGLSSKRRPNFNSAGPITPFQTICLVKSVNFEIHLFWDWSRHFGVVPFFWWQPRKSATIDRFGRSWDVNRVLVFLGDGHLLEDNNDILKVNVIFACWDHIIRSMKTSNDGEWDANRIEAKLRYLHVTNQRPDFSMIFRYCQFPPWRHIRACY